MKTNRLVTGAVGTAVGALLAPPLIALLGTPLASADPVDDLAYVGPISIGGFTETFTYNTSTYAFDSLLAGSSNLVPFDLDISAGTPGSGDFAVLFTIPLVYQGGFEDIDGTFTPISSFDAANFLSPDNGLIELGGIPPATLGVESIDLSSLVGFNDIFSINTSTLAIDNFLQGSSSGLPFDFDIYFGAPDAGAFETVFTIPSLFQVGFDDIGGVLTPLFSFNPGDFIDPDIGLHLIGGI
jgi:hypothetical protein